MIKPALLLVSLLAGLSSCATIRSNKGEGEMPAFDRILVVTNMTDTSYDFARELASAFPLPYQTCTVAHDPIAFRSIQEEIIKKATECGTNAILQIDQAGNTGSGRYSYPTAHAEMRMFPDQKLFWKAYITTNGFSFPPKLIIKQLKKDGILTQAK